MDAGRVLGFPQDDEDCVVASQSTQDLGPLLPVQGLGHGLSSPGQGAHDQEIARTFGCCEERRQQPRERRRMVPRLRREGVAGSALRIRDFDEAELANVTRQGRLGDIEAALGQQLTEMLLAVTRSSRMIARTAAWRSGLPMCGQWRRAAARARCRARL